MCIRDRYQRRVHGGERINQDLLQHLMSKILIAVTILLAVASAQDWESFIINAAAAQDINLNHNDLVGFNYGALNIDQLNKAMEYASKKDDYMRETATPILHKLGKLWTSNTDLCRKNTGLNKVLASIDKAFAYWNNDFRIMALKYKSSMERNVYEDLSQHVGPYLKKGDFATAGFNFGLIAHYLYICFLQDPKYWPNIKPFRGQSHLTVAIEQFSFALSIGTPYKLVTDGTHSTFYEDHLPKNEKQHYRHPSYSC
eukprot:TRINITY_DN1904_c0_g1_i2.p1 TRINITY_DN1904_c0_g1~~TRINITY_DN1904_c0_g1_i2.p1  ORF type:complete len:256 (-),score=46.78 TRINITY_DN1904_c0_g1_i2:127-894(-)